MFDGVLIKNQHHVMGYRYQDVGVQELTVMCRWCIVLGDLGIHLLRDQAPFVRRGVTVTDQYVANLKVY